MTQFKGWPGISSALYYDDAGAAIEWLVKAFGFAVRVRHEGEGGRIEHSELTYGEGVIMVASPRPEKPHAKSPRAIGGVNTQAMCIQVDNVDAHCAQAESAGAIIARPPATDDYGPEYGAHRSYEAIDPEGHHWWFMRVVREAGAKG